MTSTDSDLYLTSSDGPFREPMAFAAAVDASDLRARVSYISLNFAPGHTAGYFVEPRIDPATAKPFVLGYNQVFVDPVTAKIALLGLFVRQLAFFYRIHH